MSKFTEPFKKMLDIGKSQFQGFLLGLGLAIVIVVIATVIG